MEPQALARTQILAAETEQNPLYTLALAAGAAQEPLDAQALAARVVVTPATVQDTQTPLAGLAQVPLTSPAAMARKGLMILKVACKGIILKLHHRIKVT